jgi:hypothetical protein
MGHKYFCGRNIAHLDGSTTIVGDAQSDTFSAFIDNDGLLSCNNRSRHLFW